jgi:hypothetical protein
MDLGITSEAAEEMVDTKIETALESGGGLDEEAVLALITSTLEEMSSTLREPTQAEKAASYLAKPFNPDSDFFKKRLSNIIPDVECRFISKTALPTVVAEKQVVYTGYMNNDLAEMSYEGGAVFIMPGDYEIKSVSAGSAPDVCAPLNYHSMAIVGYGDVGETILRLKDNYIASGSLVYMTGPGKYNNQLAANTVVSNVTFDLNQANNLGTVFGVKCISPGNLTIENCRFIGGDGRATVLAALAGCGKVTFKHNYFEDMAFCLDFTTAGTGQEVFVENVLHNCGAIYKGEKTTQVIEGNVII